jgi:hypothetical protein
MLQELLTNVRGVKFAIEMESYIGLCTFDRRRTGADVRLAYLKIFAKGGDHLEYLLVCGRVI